MLFDFVNFPLRPRKFIQLTVIIHENNRNTKREKFGIIVYSIRLLHRCNYLKYITINDERY